jgi:hypothetical protein
VSFGLKKEETAMTQTLKIRCNGSGQHVNDVDLDSILQPTTVVRTVLAKKPADTPDRLVLPCKQCTEGRIVITRQIIEAYKRTAAS